MINVFRELFKIFQAPSKPKPTNRKKVVTDQDIEAARRTNLLLLIESLGHQPSWRGAGKTMFMSPLREEDNPSFSVSFYKGRWYWKDWGNGKSGDAIRFVQDYYGIGFLEAVVKLNGSSRFQSVSPPKQSDNHAADKAEWVRRLYGDILSLMTDGDRDGIRRYFNERRVKYYPEMGCVIHNSFKDHKSFLAIPIPDPKDIMGLECRQNKGGGDRKTLGHKTLWVLKRNVQTKRLLFAESILDALATEIVLNDNDITLCSLNGVGNVPKIDSVLKTYRPRETLFALDNDEPGRAAQATAMQIAERYCRRVTALDHHIQAGVKDMHKLLISRSLPQQAAGKL